MWPIGKRSTLYSAEILAFQKDKFHANISERRFETKFFNHYSQTKNNTESATWVKKPQSNFFFSPKKAKEKFFGYYLYYKPACWLVCRLFSFALSSVHT